MGEILVKKSVDPTYSEFRQSLDPQYRAIPRSIVGQQDDVTGRVNFPPGPFRPTYSLNGEQPDRIHPALPHVKAKEKLHGGNGRYPHKKGPTRVIFRTINRVGRILSRI